MKIKKTISNQQYENYWKLTLEYSDFSGKRFNSVLNIIIDYMDELNKLNKSLKFDEYKILQSIISGFFPKADDASTRKSINQFYKLGFINNNSVGYHPLSKAFLEADSSEKKKLILSKILYNNASFSRSFSRPSDLNEINFFIKTLEEVNYISREDLLALMTIDLKNDHRKFLNRAEIETIKNSILLDGFDRRKYNQLAYITRFLSHLDGVYYNNDFFSLHELEKIEKVVSKSRDPYLQRLFKVELINESKGFYGKPQCYVENISYPVLIASHIKPFSESDLDEAFDINNGILLSKNMDSLFDLGYISFDDYGNILFSERLEIDVINAIKSLKLDQRMLNSKRLEYLNYHRINIMK